MFSADQIADIVDAQLTTLLWSSVDFAENEEHENFDAYYSADDATTDLHSRLWDELAQCEDVEFYGADKHAELTVALNVYIQHFGSMWLSQFGHDLALTRNRHGVGFWDRGLGDAGDVLTEWAKCLGTLHIFHGHDSIHPDKWRGMFHAE